MDDKDIGQFIIGIFLFAVSLNYIAYKIGYQNGTRDKYKFALEEIKKYKDWSVGQTRVILDHIVGEYQQLLKGHLSISEKALKDMKLADQYRLEHGLLDQADKNSRLQ